MIIYLLVNYTTGQQELSHGYCSLNLLELLFSSLAKAKGESYLIMVATSGDTGPANFRNIYTNRDNITSNLSLSSHNGTSDVQKLPIG